MTYTLELLVRPEARDALDGAGRPAAWRQGDSTFPLTYAFEPGSEHDGVTVHIPLAALPQVRDVGFDWLVPAFREELVTALLRGAAQGAAPPARPGARDRARWPSQRMKPRSGPLTEVLAREVSALKGTLVPAEAFDPSALPDHLKMTFSIEDETGAVVAHGHRPGGGARAGQAAAARGAERGDRAATSAPG